MNKKLLRGWIACISIGIAIFFIGIFIMTISETEDIPIGSNPVDSDGDGFPDYYETVYHSETKFPHMVTGFIVVIVGSFLTAVGAAVVWDTYSGGKETPPAPPEARVSPIVRAADKLGIKTAGKSEEKLMDEIMRHKK